jgi:acyl carrier protein
MTHDEVFEKVRAIVSDILDVPINEVLTDSDFYADLGESLQVPEIVMACEEAFNIAIPDVASEEFRTSGQLTAYIVSILPPEEVVWPPAPSDPTR